VVKNIYETAPDFFQTSEYEKNQITLKMKTFPTKILIIFLSAILITSNPLTAQDEYNALYIRGNYWLRFTDAENSLYRYISQQATDMLAERAGKTAQLHSLSDWQDRQELLKKTFSDVFGPFPDKTPLNARTLRTIDKGTYKIEHIVFESRPGLFVTSSLFIPKKRKGKSPVIIYCSGHAAEAYRSAAYQHAILNLTNKGFIVFAFDPVGQGERIEYYDPETGKSKVGGPTSEHSYAGAQACITGHSQAGYMVWDGIRVVDYLLTRKEVDPERIGITGRSGGGTQSAYISAIDDRIYAAAPECYITNLTRVFEMIGPQDGEQNLYHGIVRGLDHPDFLTVRAPKPALLITTTNDFFSIQGARETAMEVSSVYKAYNKPENFGMVEDIEGHASTKKNREAMYAFFQKHLNNPGNPSDEEVELLTEEEMRVTSTGQVSTSLNSETVFSLNKKEAENLSDKLQAFRDTGRDYTSTIITSAEKLSGYRHPENISKPVFTGNIQREGYIIEKYFIYGEGNYPVPYLLMKPETPNDKAVIYLHPEGKGVEASEGGELEWLVKRGYTVLAADLIGIGETGPGIYRGDAYIRGTSFNIWFGSMLTGRSIAGIRAGDVNRLVLMLENTIRPDEIYGMARGDMAPVLLHAAAFQPRFSGISLIKPYSTYQSIVYNRYYNPAIIHSAVPGSMQAYDLPDLAAVLAPVKLLMINVTDATGERMDKASVVNELEIIIRNYSSQNAGEKLNISTAEDVKELREQISEWLK